jgi:hypothetical protein
MQNSGIGQDQPVHSVERIFHSHGKIVCIVDKTVYPVSQQAASTGYGKA